MQFRFASSAGGMPASSHAGGDASPHQVVEHARVHRLARRAARNPHLHAPAVAHEAVQVRGVGGEAEEAAGGALDAEELGRGVTVGDRDFLVAPAAQDAVALEVARHLGHGGARRTYAGDTSKTCGQRRSWSANEGLSQPTTCSRT
jgi:hypothetical protein